MLRIFKAELKYYKLFLVITYSLLAGLFVLFYLIEDSKVCMLNIRKMIGTGIIAALIFKSVIQTSNAKRGRLHAILPVSVNQRGIERLLFVIFFWLSLVIVFLAITFKVAPHLINRIMLWDMLSVTGIIMIFNAIILIFYDTLAGINSKISRIMLIVTFVLANVVLYLLISMSSETLTITQVPVYHSFIVKFAKIFFMSPGAAIAFLLFGLALSALSIYTLKHRRSYFG